MLTGRHHRGSRGAWTRSYTFFIGLFLFFLVPGCALLRPVERTVVQHDTTVVHRRDSIRLRDSIYVREWVRGDTVYVDRFRDRFVYRDRWRDSIRVQHDTTAVERTREVKVERPWAWYDRAALWIGRLAFLALVIYFVILFINRKK